MTKPKEEEPTKPYCHVCKGTGKQSFPNEKYVHTNGATYYGVTRPCTACAGPAAPVAPPAQIDGAKRAAGDIE